MQFAHLNYVRQSYFEHFYDAVGYSFMALKSSFYFCIHAFLPDIFEFDGSNQIEKLNTILIYKKNKIKEFHSM